MKFLEKAYKYSFEGIVSGVYQYRFISIGTKEITKIVSLSPAWENDNTYNLGFGNLEYNGTENFVNDLAEFNNNDYDEVLATVFNCLLEFFISNPKSTVLFFGNTVHKHRLYLQKISINLEALQEELEILGGVIDNLIEIEEKEHTIIRNGKEVTRTIKQKNLNEELLDKIEVNRIEKFIVKSSREYQFIMIKLKENFEN